MFRSRNRFHHRPKMACCRQTDLRREVVPSAERLRRWDQVATAAPPGSLRLVTMWQRPEHYRDCDRGHRGSMGDSHSISFPECLGTSEAGDQTLKILPSGAKGAIRVFSNRSPVIRTTLLHHGVPKNRGHHTVSPTRTATCWRYGTSISRFADTRLYPDLGGASGFPSPVRPCHASRGPLVRVPLPDGGGQSTCA